MTDRNYCLAILAADCGEKWFYIGSDMGALFEYMEEIREGEFHSEATFTSLVEIDFPDIFMEVIEVSDIPEWWYELREKRIREHDAVYGQMGEATEFTLEVLDVPEWWKDSLRLPPVVDEQARIGWTMFDMIVRIGIDLGFDAADYDLTLLQFIHTEPTLKCVNAECEFIVKTSMTLEDMHKAAKDKLDTIT